MGLTAKMLTKAQRDEVAQQNVGKNVIPSTQDGVQGVGTFGSARDQPKPGQHEDPMAILNHTVATLFAPPPATPAQLSEYAEAINRRAKLNYCLRQNAYLTRQRTETMETISQAIVALCGDDPDEKLSGYILQYRVCAKGEGWLIDLTGR